MSWLVEKGDEDGIGHFFYFILNGLKLVAIDGRGMVTIVDCWRTFFFVLVLKRVLFSFFCFIVFIFFYGISESLCDLA